MSPTPQDKSKRSSFRLGRDKRLTVPSRTLQVRSDEFAADPTSFEIAFLEGVIKRDPRHEEALRILGHTYTARGDYAQGLAMDLRLARLRPDDPTAFYNLACSFSLMNRLDESLATLRRAIELGYADLAHMMRDPDLTRLRADPRFKTLARLLRKP